MLGRAIYLEKNHLLQIAQSIINLACQLKDKIDDVCVWAIVLRTNDKILNEKGIEVNLHLKNLRKEKNNFLIDNSKKIIFNILTKVNEIELKTVQEY